MAKRGEIRTEFSTEEEVTGALLFEIAEGTFSVKVAGDLSPMSIIEILRQTMEYIENYSQLEGAERDVSKPLH